MLVQQELDKFGRYVVQQSRSNLSKNKKNASKSLYNSIKYTAKESKNSFSLSFEMEEYGQYIDKGVKGRKSSSKAPKSPFRYKNKMPPVKAFDSWVVKKGIKGTRNEKGQFLKREGLKWAIAKTIQNEGIETTNFFTLPFERAFKRLPDDLVEAYGLEVDNFLKFALQ